MAEEHVFDLIPSYALGILDEDEKKQVDEHLAGCKTCQMEVQAYKLVVDELPLGVRISTPSPNLKTKVMAQITLKDQSMESIEEIGFWKGLRNAFTSRAPAWSALSLIIVLTLVISNLLLWQQVKTLRDNTQHAMITVALRGTDNTPDATGMLVMSLDEEYGVLVVDNLPELGSDEQYQLWLIQDGQRTSGGVFSVNDEGYGSIIVSSSAPLSDYTGFGVTVEPAGGSPGPTGIKVLGGGSS